MRRIFPRVALAAACLIASNHLLGADAEQPEAPCVVIYVGTKGVCFSSDSHIITQHNGGPEEAVRLDQKALATLIKSLTDAQLEKEPEGERLPSIVKGVPPQTFSISVTNAGKTIERRFCHARDCRVPETLLKCFDALDEKAKTKTVTEFLKLNRQKD